MENKLLLKFLTGVEGKYFTLTIDEVKSDFDGNPVVTEAEVNTLMDTIIAKNIFECPYGNLTGKKEARIVSTEVTAINC